MDQTMEVTQSVNATLSGAFQAAFTGSITQAEVETSGASLRKVANPLDSLQVPFSAASNVGVGEVQLIVAHLFSGSVLRYFGTPEQADMQTNSGSRMLVE